jgi:uncharacterized protein YlbG (UPF0298 family)
MKKLIFLFAASFSLISCGKTAIGYNDTIIEPQLQIVGQLDSIFAGPEIKVEEIKKHREKIISISENALNKIRELEDFKGNNTFKNSAQKYFSFVNQYYKNTENVDSILYKFNDENRIQSIDSLTFTTTQTKFNEYLNLENNLLEEQKDFAQKFNVKLIK